MTLAEYLRKNGLSDEDFAQRVETSAFAVKKWRYRERVPRLAMMLRIERETGGEVKPADFMPGEPAPAEVA